jgi:hypothetical membrane protein
MGFKDKTYEFLMRPKTVRNSAIIGVIALAGALVVGIIIAQFSEKGYNMFENYISDLGSYNYTSCPYIWDFGQMICACAMIPAALYIRKLFATYSKNGEGIKESSRPRVILSYLCFFSMLIALVGLFGVGLFSEDRTTALHLHLFFTYVTFGGFAIVSLFFGLAITFYPTLFPRLFGLYMIILPPIACVIFFTTFIQFSEWMLMFSIMVWLVPFAIILLRHLNKEIRLVVKS